MFPYDPNQQQGPLGGLQDEIAGVMNYADKHHVYLPGPDNTMLTFPRGREPSVARDMIYGAAVGFGSWLIWRRMARRHQAKGEYTSPGYRALFFLIAPVLVGFALSMIWPLSSVAFLGIGALTGAVLAAIYSAYRVTGHGRYNTRRAGSPFRP
jgi:hypothetical protein